MPDEVKPNEAWVCVECGITFAADNLPPCVYDERGHVPQLRSTLASLLPAKAIMAAVERVAIAGTGCVVVTPQPDGRLEIEVQTEGTREEAEARARALELALIRLEIRAWRDRREPDKIMIDVQSAGRDRRRATQGTQEADALRQLVDLLDARGKTAEWEALVGGGYGIVEAARLVEIEPPTILVRNFGGDGHEKEADLPLKGEPGQGHGG